jgi:hypothetical protein
MTPSQQQEAEALIKRIRDELEMALVSIASTNLNRRNSDRVTTSRQTNTVCEADIFLAELEESR